VTSGLIREHQVNLLTRNLKRTLCSIEVYAKRQALSNRGISLRTQLLLENALAGIRRLL